LPLYSIDLELQAGIPALVGAFYEKLRAADLILISLAEHNGTYTAAFKNLFDWLSRHDVAFFKDKKVLLLATAPGARGGRGVMDAALLRFPLHGAEIVGSFCLPKFGENFDAQKGITEPQLQAEFEKVLQAAHQIAQ
jgi:chromate reductase, NAD(P)H dehydrogenase (quinone)